MRPWPAAILLLALTGCVTEPGPDYREADGPYVYDNGGYYADPRPIDYGVETRAYYSQPYYYSPGYPHSWYGGYRGYGGYRRGHDGHDHGDRNDDGHYGNPVHTQPDDGGRPDRGSSDRSRAVPDRPAKINTRSDSPSRSGGDSGRSGGPHGPGRR